MTSVVQGDTKLTVTTVCEHHETYRDHVNGEVDKEGPMWHAVERPWTTSGDSKLSFLGSHLLVQNMLHHMETWQMMKTPGMGDWSKTVAVYRKYTET